MNRKSLITRIERSAASLATLGAKTVEVTWRMAYDVVALQATYPAGAEGAKAFKATAATAAHRSESMIENLVRAVAVRESLTKAQREATEGWSYDAILTLSGKDVTSAKRTSIIGKAEKRGTQNVKDLRTFKREVMGTTKRNRRNSADATKALAESIGERVAKLVKDGKHNYVSLIAGAQLAQDHEGKDVAAALTLIASQARMAAKVVK